VAETSGGGGCGGEEGERESGKESGELMDLTEFEGL